VRTADVGSVASRAANVVVAEPALIGRVIAAWLSFTLTASSELLTGKYSPARQLMLAAVE
jgi:hypothetical protein